MNITSFDNYSLECQLSLPEGDGEIQKLVVYVHGTGPGTYENRDIYEGSEVNVFDTFSDDFAKQGTAFLMYSQRGIHATNNPPLFFDMNEEEYKTYLPLNTVEDLHYMITELKKVDRLKNSEVYLLGVSEGTVVLPLFAEKYPNEVNALFLWGYANDTLKDALIWQLSGESFINIFHDCFEMDEAGRVSRDAFDKGQKEMFVSGLGLGENAFDTCDTNQDGFIDKAEMTALGKLLIGIDADTFITAAEKNDDEWLLNNGMTSITSGWLLQHAGLRPNKEVLPELDLPITIFHGSLDMNCDVQGVYDIDKHFQKLGKSNLKTHVFQGAPHDLNVASYVVTGEMPEGIKAIFDAINNTPKG